jgi:prepilin peptidase CpaA
MSLFALLPVACLALLVALLIAAGVQDLRTMHIANGFSLAIGGLFAVWAGAELAIGKMPLGDVGLSLACGFGVFAAAAAAFAAGTLGGGDVKLLAAVSLFAGPGQLVNFLAVTAITGGLLGLAVLAGAPIGQPAGSQSAAGGPLKARLRGGLPYGPAIAAGGLWIVASQVIG